MFRILVGNTTFQKHRSCDGISDTTEQENRWQKEVTVRRRRIQMRIRRRSWNGSEIITEGIRIYPSVNCMGSWEPTKDTPGIPDHCIAFSLDWDIGNKLNQRKKNQSTTNTMTHRQSWASNGKWMLNTFLLYVIQEQTNKSFISIQWSMKRPERGSSIHIRNKAAIRQ